MEAHRLLAVALLLSAASQSAAAPLTCTPKKCTAARKGECFNKMLAEIKAADAKPKVRAPRLCSCCRRRPLRQHEYSLPSTLSFVRPWLATLACPPSSMQGYGLIFYGDSIMESLRGTDKCRSCNSISTRSSCTGVPGVLTKWFGK